MKINKKIINKFLLGASLAFVFFVILKTQAQAALENPVIGDLGTVEGAKDGSKFIDYVVYLWKVAINLGALAVIVYFLLGAFEWITSAGDSGKLEKARAKIMNAVIGLVILVSSFVILNFLSRILFKQEFNVLELSFPDRLEEQESEIPNYLEVSYPTDEEMEKVNELYFYGN